MNERYRELARNTFLLTISNFSSKVLIFLLVPIYTRALSTEEYGFYDLIYTSIQLLFPLLTVGITEGMMRFLINDDYRKEDVISIGQKCTVIGCAPFLLLLIINSVLHISGEIAKYSPYIMGYYFFFAIHSSQGQMLKGLNKVHIMAISGILGTATLVSTNLLLLLAFKLGLTGFYIANILGHAIPSLYIFFRVKQWKYLKKVENNLLQKKMILYSLPLVVNTIGWWANNASDRYVVSALCGVDVNGLISVAYKIPSIVSVLGGIFLQAWQISAIKEYEINRCSNLFKDLFVHLNALICVLSGVLIAGSKVIAKLMFANEFYSAWVFIPLLVISAMLNQAAGFVGPILNANMNSRAMAKSAFYGIVANISLNIILTLVLGPQGITIATVIGSFVIFFSREQATNGEIRSKYYSTIMFSWILLLIEAIVMIYRQSYLISIIILLVVLFLYRKSLYTIFKTGIRIIDSRMRG